MRFNLRRAVASGAAALTLVFCASEVLHADDGDARAAQMAATVTIYRDNYGVPHIDAPTDAGAVFGFAYSQAEDYFWQVEDSYIMSVGRYAEINGEAGLENDLLNRNFGIPEHAKDDYSKLDPKMKALIDAFSDGLNWYLQHHPETKPRLLTRFEPWMVVAYGHHILLTFLYGSVHLPKSANTKNLEEWRAHVGSNAWAIAPRRTKDGAAMLFANPHQPYFGYGQFIEGHLHSGEGLNFAGAALIGGAMATIGHNEFLGWSHTVNDPDVADAWVETFDDPKNPLNYRYDKGYRTATEWKDTIKVKTDKGLEERTYTFKKTHHGPIVGKKDDTHFYSARIGNLLEGNRPLQALQMAKAHNFEEFKKAMSGLSLPMFNTVYADKAGHIYYLYNGAIPRRDPSFDWEKPVDGSNPKTEWNGIHPLAELPQLVDPQSGYVQSCNSTPFMTTDDGNPNRNDFPKYMAEDKDDDKRRAKVSRLLLRNMHDITFEDLERSAFDTTLYWPMFEIPKYNELFTEVKASDPALAAKVQPYLEFLTKWDCKNSIECVQSTLCTEWYSRLYEGLYPAETLKPQYAQSPKLRLQALVDAGEKLEKDYGTIKIPWGQIHRLQRHANVADLVAIPFRDNLPSVPSAGVNGPLGIVFTVYYSPPLFGRKNYYGVVGSSFMGIYEFGDKIKSKSLLQFGQSADPKSPHFDDQAKLMSERKMKPAYFYWDDVVANSPVKYHPGEERKI